jgi:hypothetical protein
LSHLPEVVGELFESTLFEGGVRAGRGHPLRSRVECNIRTCALRKLRREPNIYETNADDGADGRRPRFVFHRAHDDPIEPTAPHPRVIPEVTVKGVEHGRVSAKLHVFEGSSLIEAHVPDDATVAVHGKQCIGPVVGGDLLEHGGKRPLGVGARRRRDGVFAIGSKQRLLNALVHGTHEQCVEPAAGVELKCPAHGLAV